MSTRCPGLARRKLSSGISDWPPARTLASSSPARATGLTARAPEGSRPAYPTAEGTPSLHSAQGRGTRPCDASRRAQGYRSRSVLQEGDRPAEGGLSALEPPGEAPELHPAVQ